MKPAVGSPEDVSFDSPGTQCWYLTHELCPLLEAHGMARVGMDDASPGYRRLRASPGGSFILETTEGEGRILMEGKWQTLLPGDVAITPPRVLNAFETATGQPWKIAYVRYHEPPGVRPLIDSGSPMRLAAHTQLGRATAGLRDEWEGLRDPQLLRHWLAIIHATAHRLARPQHGDDRVWLLWEKVHARLDALWSLQKLAATAGLSQEHLRRICLESLGRSPMQHLTYMRMQLAHDLLESSGDKIEFIARKVGYATGHAFSRAFHRCFGKLPSTLRQPEPSGK